MASLEKLQNEILLKEEAFLKEEKAKLTEQLNKLKVEEMALVKMLKPDNTHPHQTTMELFTKNSQVTVPSSSSQTIDNLETETQVNYIPLQGLNTTEMNKEVYQGEEEEEEDDDDMEDDDTEYSQQLLNAMSNLHYQNSNADQDISRSVLHSILQQEIEGLDEEEDDYKLIINDS